MADVILGIAVAVFIVVAVVFVVAASYLHSCPFSLIVYHAIVVSVIVLFCHSKASPSTKALISNSPSFSHFEGRTQKRNWLSLFCLNRRHLSLLFSFFIISFYFCSRPPGNRENPRTRVDLNLNEVASV